MLDLALNAVTYSTAAQFPYPIVYDEAGGRFLPCRSRPVGLFEDAEFPSQSLELRPGCILLLVSDGVLEILPGRTIREKQDALLCAIREPNMTLRQLSTALGLNHEQRFPDDVTFLMVKHDV